MGLFIVGGCFGRILDRFRFVGDGGKQTLVEFNTWIWEYVEAECVDVNSGKEVWEIEIRRMDT